MFKRIPVYVSCHVMSCQWHTDRSWFVDSKSSLATQGESEESVKSAVMTQWQIN